MLGYMHCCRSLSGLLNTLSPFYTVLLPALGSGAVGSSFEPCMGLCGLAGAEQFVLLGPGERRTSLSYIKGSSSPETNENDILSCSFTVCCVSPIRLQLLVGRNYLVLGSVSLVVSMPRVSCELMLSSS